MKKFITLCLGLFAALSVQAQADFAVQFCDKDGNIIADGTTLNLTEAVVDDWGEVQMPTGLSVKNYSDAEVRVGGIYTIKSISSGSFQSCPFGSCMKKDEAGEYETTNGTLAAGATDNLMSEWFPEAPGTCEVTYQLFTYKQNAITGGWNKDQAGPTITLKFNYTGTSGVSSAKAGKAVSSVEFYNLTGRRVAKPAHGVFVKTVRYADGKSVTRKVVVK